MNPPELHGSNSPLLNMILELYLKSISGYLPPKKSKAKSYFGLIPYFSKQLYVNPCSYQLLQVKQLFTGSSPIGIGN